MHTRRVLIEFCCPAHSCVLLMSPRRPQHVPMVTLWRLQHEAMCRSLLFYTYTLVCLFPSLHSPRALFFWSLVSLCIAKAQMCTTPYLSLKRSPQISPSWPIRGITYFILGFLTKSSSTVVTWDLFTLYSDSCLWMDVMLYVQSMYITPQCVLCLLCEGIYTLYLHCQVLSRTHRETEASWLWTESASCCDLCKTVNSRLGCLSLSLLCLCRKTWM